MNDNITILCSGFGLGFYIPGVLLLRELQKNGDSGEIYVFETFMKDERQNHIQDSRNEYHENFAAANLAARIPLNIEKSIDYEKVDKTFTTWKEEKRAHFVSLSGHWIYIMERYKEQVDWPVSVVGLYVDAGRAPSWNSLKRYMSDCEQRYTPICLYDEEKLEMNYSIGTTLFDPIGFTNRKHNVVVHGGGWGMGTYREIVHDLLEKSDFSIDLLAYKYDELYASERISSYINDPNWCAWSKDKNNLFPDFYRKTLAGQECRASSYDYHWLAGLSGEEKAIIAKPGAGTLIDSFMTETPLVILPPFGKHESKNAEVWKKLGFGVDFETWTNNGYSESLLEAMHIRIHEARKEVKKLSEKLCDL